MKAMADGHINFVLWLSDGQTFSDQPVVVNSFDGVRSFFGVSRSSYNLSPLCPFSLVQLPHEFQRHSFAHRLC